MRATCFKPPSHFHLCNILFLHNLCNLECQNSLHRLFGRLFIGSLFFKKILEQGTYFSFFNSFSHFKPLILLCARSSSSAGVFCVFLMNPCKSTIAPSCIQNNTRAMRLPGKFVLISYNPLRLFIERHSGIPIGHPNSAVRMSSPITLRSLELRDKSHSRTGSLPPLDSKNLAGSRFLSAI